MSVSQQLKGLAFDWADRIIPVKPVERSAREQNSIDRESRRMQLYFSRHCPSAVAVRRHCQKLGLRIVEKDVDRVDCFRNELINGGGASLVPCMRVEAKENTQWLYGEEAIVSYVDSRFSPD
ncbi:MAG: glutaredoxin [Oceanospirillaceae bacterium]|nr:glutaredoxin [Oceanospirillaceae bacterium]|tara:strand:- start:1620 stop:1985 length:366 start_codon:yes stop_codon:yes gene_type:complete